MTIDLGRRDVEQGDRVVAERDHCILPVLSDDEVRERPEPADGAHVDRVDAELEILDHVVAEVRFEIERVATRSTAQDIVTQAAVDPVGTLATLDDVVSGTAVENVVSSTTIEDIIPVLAMKPVIAAFTKEDVIANAAVHLVIPGTGFDDVVSGVAIEEIVSGIAEDQIVALTTEGSVISGACLDEVVTFATVQAVRVRLTAFDQRTTPELDGVIAFIAPDVRQDSPSLPRYYAVRAKLDPSEIARIGSARLVPGMPVELMIQRQPRTVLSYFVKPLADQLARAFRED